MAKHKNVRRVQTPPQETKKPRIPLETWAQQPFRWKVSDNYIDMKHEEWGWGDVPIEDFFEILKKSLHKYEEMSWKDVLDRKNCHPLPLYKAVPKAKERFCEICSDVDTLHQVDFSELGRVWGVKKGQYFQLVWHDPNHTVCPTKRR
ncbi:hypothetical protein ACFLV2_01025 [Chloroflexota bacterium]